MSLPDPSPSAPDARRHGTAWTFVVAGEVAVCAAAIAADVFVPTVVILIVATVSLTVRRERWSTLGFVRRGHEGRMAIQVFGLVVVWSLLQLGVFIPILEHLTGSRQDMSVFEDVESNLLVLIGFLLLSWTLAAFGEETAYRGFIQTRLTDVFGSTRYGVGAAVGITAVLFGVAHTEQGAIGVAITTLDALFFGYLRLRYATLWAPILAHGFNNTIGLTAFYLVGPIYGLW